MAFITEFVPKKDWEMYNSWGLKNTSGQSQLANEFKMWTSSRERKVYFFLLGGHGADAPDSYALMWGDDYILVNILGKVCINDNSSKELHYNICRIVAPKRLSDKANEIMSLIDEVVKAEIYGNPKNLSKNTDFIIDDISSPEFVENVKEVRA